MYVQCHADVLHFHQMGYWNEIYLLGIMRLNLTKVTFKWLGFLLPVWESQDSTLGRETSNYRGFL